MKPNNNLTVALYERLSHDDEQQGESFSISNQKLLLETYAREHGMNNYKHFFDDGISGTRFDRPGFMAMMNGIKDGEIGTVIVKDMSRLGRDYLMVGQIQEMLRQKNVRLIAINDNHDSIHGDDDLLPFKNIMNEWYAKDTSKKIRSTFQAKGKAGKHVASSPVYGYIKNPENKEEWIVDREAAEVVKRIYRRTVEGAGPYQIARELEADKIDIPAVHLQKLGFGLHQKVKFDEPYHWWGSTVTHLLDKREYLGHTVNFKTRKHFKDKKSHYVDESEWLIFENTHEPIIDEETWNIVHRIRGNCKRYPNGWGEVNPLTGIVVCADCGRPMHQHRTSNGKRECNYVCANYSKSPVGTVCPSGHRVKGEAVLELVKQTLRDIRAYVDLDEEGFLKEMEKGVEDEHRDEIILAQRKVDSNNKRLGEIESLFCRMYEDNILGKLPDSRYEALSKQYDAEQERLRHEICEIEKTLAGFHTETKDGTKTENENYFLLTLAGIAKELQYQGKAGAEHVELYAGVPLTLFGAERKEFRDYLWHKERISFTFEGVHYSFFMDKVKIYAQCYAAIANRMGDMDRLRCVDLGSWTLDVLSVRDRIPMNKDACTYELGLITTIERIKKDALPKLKCEIPEDDYKMSR